MPTRSLYCQPAKVVIIECYSHEEMTAECFVQTVLKALIQLFETIDMHRPVKIEPNRKGSHKVLCQSIPLLSVHLVGQRAEQLMALDYVKPLVTSNVLRLKFQNVTSIVSGLSSPDMKPEDVKLLQLIRNTIAEFNTFSAMHRIQQENPRNKKDVMLLESADLHILSLRHLKYILNDVNQIGFDHMSNIKVSIDHFGEPTPKEFVNKLPTIIVYDHNLPTNLTSTLIVLKQGLIKSFRCLIFEFVEILNSLNFFLNIHNL